MEMIITLFCKTSGLPFAKDLQDCNCTQSDLFIAYHDVPIYVQTKTLLEVGIQKNDIVIIHNVSKEELVGIYKEKVGNAWNGKCQEMLENWKLDELKKVYDVLCDVDGSLNILVDIVEGVCKKEGEIFTKNQPRSREECVVMVEELIKLWEKYDSLLKVSFSKRLLSTGEIIIDDDFKKSIRRAFTAIMSSQKIMPEYLSLYLDSNIRLYSSYSLKKMDLDSIYDNIFEEVIKLLNFIREKDVFEKYYKIHLGRRLLQTDTKNILLEKTFLEKLRKNYGHSITTKAFRMLTDMMENEKLGRQLDCYKVSNNFRIKHGYDLNMMVLTSGCWPISERQIVADVPNYIQEGVKMFQKMYMENNRVGELAWVWGLGSAEVIANGYSDMGYILDCSTIQLLILEIFNKNKIQSFGDLLQQTKLPAKVILHHLKCLYTPRNDEKSTRVLQKEKGPKMIANKTKFQSNEEFSSTSTRLRVIPPEKTKKEKVLSELDEDRKWQLDACIVRIMKRRKVLHHDRLIAKVTEEMKPRWEPKK